MRSESTATTVVTAVVPSSTVTEAKLPPPFEVMTGVSPTFSILTEIVWLSLEVPSLAPTITRYVLSPLASPGAS